LDFAIEAHGSSEYVRFQFNWHVLEHVFKTCTSRVQACSAA